MRHGRRELGCRAVTPPWLSVYTDGCADEWSRIAPGAGAGCVVVLVVWWSW